LRFGLIGAGGIAQSYVQAFHVVEEAELVAVADVREDSAKAMAEGGHCDWYTSHAAMSDAAKCDAVLVCTPPSTHADICTYFLERKVPVLCEKPLCTSSETARELVGLAADQEVMFTMASKFRFVDDVVRAKSIVTSGVLGEVVLFENAFTSRVNMANRWNSDPAIGGGGVIIDNGTHSVDVMRYFLGPIAEVFAVEGKRVQNLAVEDTARVFIRSVGGVLGTIDLSWSLNKERDTYVEIYGSHGVVRVGWKSSMYRQLSSQDWIVFGRGYDKLQAMSAQIRNFAKAITGEQQLVIGPEDGVASVETVEVIYRSLGKNLWTPVNGETPERRSRVRAPLAAN
jgi:predicted dehydrogenase